MIATERKTITVEANIHAPVEKVWELWTDPKHIVRWSNASDDWHTPKAENDVRVGGKFSSRMEARDGSMGFDFNGEYTKVELHKRIEYTLADDRKVQITFTDKGNETEVKETFEAEDTNSTEMQQQGWQAIMDNFKKYVEKSNTMNSLHFEITMGAPVEKVYRIMLDEPTYKEWTAIFNPTSHFKGSWEKGSKIIFVGTDENGKMGGMVSRIRENIPNKFVSIEHMGIIQDDNEITSGAEVEGWAGALENYTFKEVNGKTLLSIDNDANAEFESYLLNTWPKALDKLKEMCER